MSHWLELERQKNASKIKRMNYSMGLFVYYFGSKKKYNDVQHHTIYFGDSYKDLLNK